MLIVFIMAALLLAIMVYWANLYQGFDRVVFEHRMAINPLIVYLGTDVDCQSEHARVLLVKKFEMTIHCFVTDPPIDVRDNDTLVITKNGEEWTLDVHKRILERTFVPLKKGAP